MAKRSRIPAATQAKVQFDADRTCCVCRTPGKPIQIHHIDEDPTNHDIRNLAVLCRDCHDLTMVKGTFNRRLDADVVTLYRDDWMAVIAQRRANHTPAHAFGSAENSIDFANVVEKLEILKERKQYLFLAIEYDRLQNIALRDKYIELALNADHSDTTTLFLRALQKQPDKVPRETVARIIERQTTEKSWSQLARTYADILDYRNAAINYCKDIIQNIEDGNIFSAAFYLKELTSKELHASLFRETYDKYEADGNLWWALRSLQELGWSSEVRAFLLRNERKIKAAADPMLLKELCAAKGDIEGYRRIELEQAATIFSRGDMVGFMPRRRRKRAKLKTT